MNTLRTSLLTLALLSSLAARAADSAITTPGGQFNFNFSGTNSPLTLTLVRGRLYEFTINTSSFHPFQIMSNTAALGPAQGVTNNNIFSGTLFFRVPTNAANYSYRCGVHTGSASLQGSIITVPPPEPPPAPRIVAFEVGTNLVLRSAPGTNTLQIIPEFRTNLNFTNWVALPVQTNRFFSGTNETICGRPQATNVFIRIRVL